MAACTILGRPVFFKCVRPLLPFWVDRLASYFVILLLVRAFAFGKKCAARFASVMHPVLASVQLREHVANG
eukprot:4389543-Pleurochrysis_carterae.AAC.1